MLNKPLLLPPLLFGLLLALFTVLIPAQAAPLPAPQLRLPTPTPYAGTAVLHCNTWPAHSGGCPADDTEMLVSGARTSGAQDQLDWNGQVNNCTGPACVISALYRRAFVTFIWNSGDYNNDNVSIKYTLSVNGHTEEITIPCGNGFSGSCQYIAEDEINPAWLPASGGFAWSQSATWLVCGNCTLNLVATFYFSLDSTTSAPCEDQYQITSTLATTYVLATNDLGNHHSITDTAWFQIETLGGPWNDGDGDSTRYDLELSFDQITWYDLGDIPSLTCEGQTIPNYTKAIFQSMSSDLYIRVNDSGDFSDNSGAMGYRLSWLSNTGGPGACASNYAVGSLITYSPGRILASAPYGDHIPPWQSPMPGEYTLTPGNVYMLDITAPAWHENGVDSYAAEMSHTGIYPSTWYTLETHPDVLCWQPIGLRQRIFFQAGSYEYYLRADDEDGVWSNNTLELTYNLYASTALTGTSTGCDEYALTNIIADYSHPAYQAGGYDTAPTNNSIDAGSWYAIEIITPPWMEYYDITLGPSSGSPTYTAQANLSTIYTDQWFDFEDFPVFSCVETNNTGRSTGYWLASESSVLPAIRARDADGDWNNNIGDINYRLWSVSYGSPPDPCEGAYRIGETVISEDIPVSTESGRAIPTTGYPELIAGQTYRLSTMYGPWDDGTDSRYDAAISDDDGATWYNLPDYPSALCTGGLRYQVLYFTAQAGSEYKIRVNDTAGQFANNTGQLMYTLSIANPLSSNGCDGYTLGPLLDSIQLNASTEAGTYAPLDEHLTLGMVYAVETAAGPWYDAATPSYSATVSADDGDTYFPWDEYPGFLCAEKYDGDHVRSFFSAQLPFYRWQVDDSDDDFTNNAGQLTLNIYSTINDPPPAGLCSANYTDLTLLSTGVISSTDSNGTSLAEIAPGVLFKLSITDGPWQDNAVDSYAAQITDDGGSNWYDLAAYPLTDCCITSTVGRNTIYFTANDGTYAVRVADGDTNFANNTGELGYTLSEAHNADTGIDVDPPPDWDGACSLGCAEPTGWGTDYLAGWMSYTGCRIVLYFSWCPHHTARWQALPQIVANVEPIGSIEEFTSAFEAEQALLSQYNWEKGVIFTVPNPRGQQFAPVQQGISAPSYSTLFAPNQTTSPYFAKNVQTTLTDPLEYTTNCNFSLSDTVGPKMAQGVCFVYSIMNTIGVLGYFELIINFIAIVMLGMYVTRRWFQT